MPSVKMAHPGYRSGVQSVDTLTRMDAHHYALAAEIRGEMAANRITARAMQQRVGVSSSAWANYFVACARDVPISVVADVAEALGLRASELLRRAEERAATLDPSTVELEAGLSRGARKTLDETRGEGGGAADPQGRARADHDDGGIRTAG